MDQSSLKNTRQMIIIVGGEPELSCGTARHGMAKQEGGVCVRPYALRMRKSCPECSVHVYVEKCEKGFV